MPCKHYRFIVATGDTLSLSPIKIWKRFFKTRYAVKHALRCFGGVTWTHAYGSSLDLLTKKIVTKPTLIFDIGIRSNFDRHAQGKQALYYGDYLRSLFEQDSIYIVQPFGGGFFYDGMRVV